MTSDLPDYDDLPAAAEGGRSGWGLFGPDDNLGLVNLLTPERVVAAARLIRMEQPVSARLAVQRSLTTPGIAESEDVCRYL